MLLEVGKLSVSYGKLTAVKDVSFAVEEGKIATIIGPNGAGKTTFMDIVTGKTRPDSGTVTFGERAVSLLDMNEAQIARAGIGRKFQRPTVFEDQTVQDNLILALKANRSPWRVLASKFFSAARASPGRSRQVPIVSAPTNALCIASRTPLENTGSMKANASPTMSQPFPAIFSDVYE